MKLTWILVFSLIAGCASLESIKAIATAQSIHRTHNAPIGRVKPAYVSTLASMGMMISSIEMRDGREVLKASKGASRAEVEFERLGPASTRVRVAMNAGTTYDAAATSKIVQQVEKVLGGP